MTRTSKKLKRAVSLLAVVIILCSITITPAHAVTGFSQKSRAFVASALAALNIVTQSATMDTASLIEYIADPMEVQYTYLDAWQDRPEIQIYPDYTVIDGVSYTDIWISNEAAEKFRVDAFDFKTAYQIASQSNGTFATGLGQFDGIDIYNVNGVTKSQRYVLPLNQTVSVGNGTGLYSYNSGNYNKYGISFTNSNNGTSIYNTRNSPITPNNIEIRRTNSGDWKVYCQDGTQVLSNNQPSTLFVNQPFSYNWVAQEIPADTQLPSDTGMMIRVPSNNPVTDEPYFDDWLTDNPEFNQGQPVTIDVNLDPTIETKLNDLLDIIIPIMPLINNNVGDIQFIENHTEPVPQPDTLLPDTYWSQLETKLDQIRQTIQNLTPDFSQIIQAIQNIPQSFSQITQPITQAITNLGNTILEDIEQGPIRLLDKLIDVLRSIFFPILATLKSFLGIWHYVVEWIGNISAPFAWIIGIMQGTSAIMMSPIYAVIAGAIVIAVYRRFGK